MGFLHPHWLSYGLTPSALARGTILMSRLIVGRNTNGALRYHENVRRRFPRQTALLPGSVLHGLRDPIGLELGLNLRDIVPEHDDVVGFAVDIADMITQKRLGAEAETLEQGNRSPLIDRHLHGELLQLRP